MPLRFRAVLALAVLALATARPAPVRAQGPASAATGRVARTTVDGVGIEYVDWGGRGTALVFLPGFGNSAHVFGTFAPRFTDRHRVVAVTRVGFGGSDAPERDVYTLEARVAQLRGVLDALGIQRAVLAGHSLAGDEITEFARRHPERTAGLVYLDAALDHAEALKQETTLTQFFTRAPRVTREDLRDATAYRAYLTRIRGVEFPLAEVRATVRTDATGMVVGEKAPQFVNAAILRSTPRLVYAGVKAPVLALYADWQTAADVLPFLAADRAATARATAVLDTTIRPWTVRERARLQRELPQARVVAFRSHHYQFLSHPAETERYMRDFLRAVPVAAR